MRETHLTYEIVVPMDDDLDMYKFEGFADTISCNMSYDDAMSAYVFYTTRANSFSETVQRLAYACYDFEVSVGIEDGYVMDNIAIL